MCVRACMRVCVRKERDVVTVAIVNLWVFFICFQDGEAAEYSQRHWSGGRGGGQRGSSFQGSWFSHGLRQSQPNTSLWNTQETHGRRFYGNASYKRPWKEDEGNQREQTVSGGQGSGEDLQKNYRQRHETTRTGRTEYVNVSINADFLYILNIFY